MATTYVSLENLSRFKGNMETYINSAKTNSFKSLLVKDNAIHFYCDPEPAEGAEADFTVDMPVEFFLDQTKTVFVQDFAWDELSYPGSTDPGFDGKPVLVLAVKGDDTVNYSFLNMETLIDIYEGENSDSITLTVDKATNKISAEIKISSEAGNILSIKEDGLFAEAVLDISGKADKITEEVKADQILVDDGEGNLKASGKTLAEFKTEILDEFEAISDEEIDALFQN